MTRVPLAASRVAGVPLATSQVAGVPVAASRMARVLLAASRVATVPLAAYRVANTFGTLTRSNQAHANTQRLNRIFLFDLAALNVATSVSL